MRKRPYVLGASALAVIFLLSAFNMAEWKLIYKQKGITISEQETICTSKNGHQFLVSFLKIENNDNYDKIVEWDVNTYNSSNVCMNCDGGAEQHNVIKIKAKQTLEGTCEGNEYKSLKFSKKYIPVGVKLANESDVAKLNEGNTIKFNNFIVKTAE